MLQSVQCVDASYTHDETVGALGIFLVGEEKVFVMIVIRGTIQSIYLYR